MDGPIVIAGAGSIGCFVGGLLALRNEGVVLLARPRIAEEVAGGLQLGSFEGWSEEIASERFTVLTDPAVAFANASVILVTVKSGATDDMARLIVRYAPAGCGVISLQNGLDNAARLRALLLGRQVYAGMVSFNVLHAGKAHFHRGTSGPVIVEEGAPPLEAPHLDIRQHPRMDEVLAGKLIYNLNNALNALSGLTLRQQLADRRWRLRLAACQEEALAVFKATGVEAWSLGNIPVARFPKMLRLPDFLFRIIAKRAVRIDAKARSSMWEDLERSRPTEIDELQGKIVALAEQQGLPAPMNAAVLAAVRAAEKQGSGSPHLSPETLHLSATS